LRGYSSTGPNPFFWLNNNEFVNRNIVEMVFWTTPKFDQHFEFLLKEKKQARHALN